MSVTQILALVVFVGAYFFIATEKINRVAAALGGAALMLALGFTDGDAAFYSEDSGIDWNVIFLLFGMMVIVGVLKNTGLFEALAIYAAKKAKGRPFKVLVLLVVITAVASAALDNVTTVLLIAPVTFLVCERLALPVVPFLIAEVMASNIGGAGTLIGDPPNIIIASRGDLSFNDFLLNLGPFAALHDDRADRRLPGDVPQVVHLRPRPGRGGDGALRGRGDPRPHAARTRASVVLVLVLAGFVLSPVLGYSTPRSWHSSARGCSC